MKTRFNALLMLLVLWVLCASTTELAAQDYLTAQDYWADKLEITLSIGEKSLTADSLLLTMMLINKTDSPLTLKTPIYAHQLSIYSFTPKGRKARLNDLLKQVKGRHYSSKILHLKPKETMVFNQTVDLSGELSDEKQDIGNQPFIEFIARFDVFRDPGKPLGIDSLFSNTLKVLIK